MPTPTKARTATRRAAKRPSTTRLSLVAGVKAVMARVARLSKRARKVAPETGAHWTLNVAFWKLEQAAVLLRQRGRR